MMNSDDSLSDEIYAYVWNRSVVFVSVLFSAVYNHAPIKMTLLGTDRLSSTHYLNYPV